MFMIWCEYARRKNWQGVQQIHNRHRWHDGDEYQILDTLPRDRSLATALGYPLEEDPLRGGLTAPDHDYLCIAVTRGKIRAEQAKSEAMKIQKEFGVALRDFEYWTRQFSQKADIAYKQLAPSDEEKITEAEIEELKEKALNHPVVRQASEELDAAESRLQSYRDRFKSCQSVIESSVTEFYVIPVENLELVDAHGLDMRGTKATIAGMTLVPLEK